MLSTLFLYLRKKPEMAKSKDFHELLVKRNANMAYLKSERDKARKRDAIWPRKV